MDSQAQTTVSELLSAAVAEHAWPGAVLVAGRHDRMLLRQACGFHTYACQRATALDDIFDLASLTKPVATTTALMLLYEGNRVDLDNPVTQYLPQFGDTPTAEANQHQLITTRQLLTHTSGLPAYRALHELPGPPATRLAAALSTPLVARPGTTCVYSDVGFIVLGTVVEAVSGCSLDQFVQGRICEPLGLQRTCFRPPQTVWEQVVPTERRGDDCRTIQGRVHDENAHALGGVAGHAGLFGTADDVATVARVLLNGGLHAGRRVLQDKTVAAFTRATEVVPGVRRCLGWDCPAGVCSGGVYLSDSSYGHTGFTGTSLWIGPAADLFVLLLTNAVHPTREGRTPSYFDWRQRIHAAVYEAAGCGTRNPRLSWRKRWLA